MLLQINSQQLRDGAVIAAKIASNAVTTAKILDANVTNVKLASGIDAAKVADGSVSNTEFQYIGGLTSDAQTQLTSNASAITAEAATRLANDNTETAARIAGDAQNASDITAEATARASADTALSDAAATEHTARLAAESTLQGNIDTEAAARAAGDATNATAISSEATTARAAESTLTTNLASEVTNRTNAVSAEATARIAGDAAAVTSAEGYTDAAITSEVTRAEAAYVNVTGDTMSGSLTMGAGAKVMFDSSYTPGQAYDSATKGYVDAAVSGLHVHAAAQVATTGSNIDLSSAPAAIDGVTLASGNRVLVKDQTSAKENGIYVFNGVGSAMTRSTDASTSAEMSGGDFLFVESGTLNHAQGFVQTVIAPVLDTDALTWTQFSGVGDITPGYALSKTGNVLDALFDGASIDVNGSNQLEVKDAGITTAKLASASVTNAKLGISAVQAQNIADGNVTDQKLDVGINANKIADGTVSNTEFQYINSLTSNVQTQLDSNASAITAESTSRATADSAILSNLASTANGLGASTVGVEDAAGHFTATTVEGVLAELFSDISTTGTDVSRLETVIGISAGATQNTFSSVHYVAAHDSLDTAVGKLDAALNTEASTRASADTTLQTNIDAEATTARAAEATLQTNIDAEATTARAAESTLTTNLASEVTRATAAEAALDAAKVNRVGDTMTGQLTMQDTVDTGSAPILVANNALTHGAKLQVGYLAIGTTNANPGNDQNNTAWVDPTFGASIGIQGSSSNNVTKMTAGSLTVTTGGVTTTLSGSASTINGSLTTNGTVSLNGTSGVTVASGNSISWATAPTTGNHLTNKTYVDAGDAASVTTAEAYTDAETTRAEAAEAALDTAKVNRAGDTMTGELFITAAGTGLNVSNDVIIGGNLTVNGTTTHVNSTTVDIGDANIELASGVANAAGNSNGGISVKRFDGLTQTDAIAQWNETAGNWEAGKSGNLSALVRYAELNATTGAGQVGFDNTAGSGLSASTVQAALDELEGQIDTVETSVTTEATARAAADATLQSNIDAEAATRLANDNTEAAARAAADTAIRGDLASNANAKGASLVGIEDAGNFFTSTTVEAAFAELAAAGALLPNHSTYTELLVDSTAAATNASGTFDVTITACTSSAPLVKTYINGMLQVADNGSNSAYAAYTKPNTTTIRFATGSLLEGDVIQLHYSV
jgi:hypothetical protein